jgi:hypothetical protein
LSIYQNVVDKLWTGLVIIQKEEFNVVDKLWTGLVIIQKEEFNAFKKSMLPVCYFPTQLLRLLFQG